MSLMDTGKLVLPGTAELHIMEGTALERGPRGLSRPL